MLLSSRYNMASKIIKHSIEIAIQPEFKSLLKSSWIRNIVKHTLKEVVPSTDYSVSVAVIDDQTMRDLNFQFRNFDETTDVLAFGNHGEFEIDSISSKDVEFPPIQPWTLTLGEVVISYPQALKQAEENNVSLNSEITMLTVHGILHLLGYDHHDEDQDDIMKKMQASIIACVPSNVKGDSSDK